MKKKVYIVCFIFAFSLISGCNIADKSVIQPVKEVSDIPKTTNGNIKIEMVTAESINTIQQNNSLTDTEKVKQIIESVLTVEYNASFVLDSKVFFIDRDGNGWKEVTPLDAEGISNSYFIDRDNGWTTSFDSDAHVKVYRTNSGGRTWDVSDISEPGYSTDVSFVDKDHGWILIHQEGAMFKEKAAVLQTKDRGVTWNVVSR